MRTNLLMRAFSFLLITLLVAAALPTGLIGMANTAKAEEQTSNSQKVASSQANEKNRIIGVVAIRNASITPIAGITADGCLSYEVYVGAPYTITENHWYCVTDGEELPDSDMFEAGKEYYLCYEIVAADGYEFSEDVVITINNSLDIADMENTHLGDGDPTRLTVCTYPSEAMLVRIIDTITITNARVTPIAGRTAGDCVDYDVPGGGYYTCFEHNWYCNTDSAPVANDSVFEEGKLYSLYWRFNVAAGYDFSEDTVVTINGYSGMLDMSITAIDSDFHSEFVVWTLPMEAMYVRIVDTVTITNADVTPYIGKPISENLDYELPAGIFYECLEHYWYCTDDMSVPATGSFEEGKEYSLYWYFILADGYAFSDDTEVTINGSSDIVELALSPDGDPTFIAVWTYQIEAVPINIIDTITITNASTTPVIGKTVGEYLNYEIPEDANYTVTDYCWFCDTDFEVLQSTDLFENNKEYSLYWSFMAAEGYEFSEDTVVTINGGTEILDMENSGIEEDPALFEVFTQKTEAEDIILDTIEIVNADLTPIPGETAGDHLSYELPTDAHYHVEQFIWAVFTDGVFMANDDIFFAGKEYCAVWHIAADDGYRFASDTTMFINDSEANVYVVFSNVSIDGYYCTLYSIPIEAVEAPEFELGDVNMDGVINTGDAVIILRQNVGIVTFTEEQEVLADYNKDGKVNTGDAVAVLRYCVSKAER